MIRSKAGRTTQACGRTWSSKVVVAGWLRLPALLHQTLNVAASRHARQVAPTTLAADGLPCAQEPLRGPLRTNQAPGVERAQQQALAVTRAAGGQAAAARAATHHSGTHPPLGVLPGVQLAARGCGRDRSRKIPHQRISMKTKTKSRARAGRPAAKTPAVALAGLTRRQMIDLVGCGDSTFDRWRKAGLPQRKDGLFDLGEAVRWIWAQWSEALKSPGTDESVLELTRWRKLRSANEALKLQKVRGELLPRSEIVDEWASRAFAVSRRFLALPRQIAGAITASPEVRSQVESEADRVVREALLDYVREGSKTPTPPELQDLDAIGRLGGNEDPTTSVGS